MSLNSFSSPYLRAYTANPTENNRIRYEVAESLEKLFTTREAYIEADAALAKSFSRFVDAVSQSIINNDASPGEISFGIKKDNVSIGESSVLNIEDPLDVDISSGTANIRIKDSDSEPGTYTKVTVDDKGLVQSGTNLTSEDLPNHGHDAEDIAGLEDIIGDIDLNLLAHSLHPSHSFNLTNDKLTLTEKWANIFEWSIPEIPSDITPVEILHTDSTATIQGKINANPAGTWFLFRANNGQPHVYQECFITSKVGNKYFGELGINKERLVRVSGSKDIKSRSATYHVGTVGTNAVYYLSGTTETPSWTFSPISAVQVVNGGSGYTPSITNGTWTSNTGASGTYSTNGSGVITSATVSVGGNTQILGARTFTINGPGTGAVFFARSVNSNNSGTLYPYISAADWIFVLEKAGDRRTCPLVDTLAACEANPFSAFMDYAAQRLYINTGTFGLPSSCDYIWMPQRPQFLAVVSTTTAVHPLFCTGVTDQDINNLIVEGYWGQTLQDSAFGRPPTGDGIGFAANTYSAPSRINVQNCEIRNNTVGIVLTTGSIVRRNYIHRNYDLNCISSNASQWILEGNRIEAGNTFSSFVRYSSIWESGGTKFARCKNTAVINNYVADNDGKGLWYDIRNEDNLIAYNVVVYNTEAGIMIEVSFTGNKVYCNYLYKNGFKDQNFYTNNANIFLSSTPGCIVKNNAIYTGGAPGSGKETDGHGIIIVAQQRLTETATRWGGTKVNTKNQVVYGCHISGNVTVFVAEQTSQFTGLRGLTGFATDISDWTLYDQPTASSRHPAWLGGPDVPNGNYFENEYYYVTNATQASHRHWILGKLLNTNQSCFDLTTVATTVRSVDSDFPHTGQFYGSEVSTSLPSFDPGDLRNTWNPNRPIAAIIYSKLKAGV